MNLPSIDNIKVVALLAVGVAAFVALRKARELALIAGDVLTPINPASPNNVVYSSITAAVSAMTGSQETLGGWLAEVFDANTREVNRQYRPTTPAPTSNTGIQGLPDDFSPMP